MAKRSAALIDFYQFSYSQVPQIEHYETQTRDADCRKANGVSHRIDGDYKADTTLPHSVRHSVSACSSSS